MQLDQYLPILWFLLGLAAVWIVLRFVLRLASKVFSIGCSLLLALGVLLVVIRYFSGS